VIQPSHLLRRRHCRRRVALWVRVICLATCWSLPSVPVRVCAQSDVDEQESDDQADDESSGNHTGDDDRADAQESMAAGSGDVKRDAEYQQLINYALDEYERGSWEESAALFRRAHALIPSARTLRGLGLATYEARRYAESIRHLRAALQDTRRPLPDKQREAVQATLDRAKIFVGQLEIDRVPADAQVMINGRVAEPDSDGKFMVDSGWVDIEVSAPSYTPRTRRMRLAGGEEQRIALHLSPLDASPSDPSPALGLRRAAPSGVAQSSLPRADSEADRPFQTWKWVTGGAAVVALGVGGSMLGIQKALAPAYERECTQAESAMPADCEQRHTLLSSTLWTGSIVGLSLGGALAALSATFFVLDAQEPDSEPALVCGGMGSLGVTCRARF